MKRIVSLISLVIILLCNTSYAEPRKNTLDGGEMHVIGLKEDGTVLSAYIGDKDDKYYNQCDTERWTDIVSVSAGYYMSLGLKADGTVVAAGKNTFGATSVENWHDIIDIDVGGDHSVGLKNDGTVVAVGYNDSNQLNVSAWTNVIDVAAGISHTLGLREDGTVLATGSNEYGQCNVRDWTDIVAVAAGDWISVGLKKNGRVVYAGGWDSDKKAKLNTVKSWENIVYISVVQGDVFGIDVNGKMYSIYSRFIPTVPTAAVAFCHWRNWGTFLLADGTIDSRIPEIQGMKLQLPDHYQLPNTESTGGNRTAAASSKSANMGIWTLKAYVDEFDMPTDEYFIVNKQIFTGKFSNSATNNSELEAVVFCERTRDNSEYISIRLFEYGKYRVNNTFSKTRYYDIVMMDNAGSKYYFEGYISPEHSDILVDDDVSVSNIINALKKGGTVRFAITDQNNNLTKYIFSIDNATGFENAYDAWWIN